MVIGFDVQHKLFMANVHSETYYTNHVALSSNNN